VGAPTGMIFSRFYESSSRRSPRSRSTSVQRSFAISLLRALVKAKSRIVATAAGLAPASSALNLSGLMVAAGARGQNPALRRDRPDLFMSLDKGLSHRDSLAEYAAAFFRMSRSMRVFASSAFSHVISI